MTKIENETRARIAAFLPDALAVAIASYQKFAEQPAPDEAKEFTAHHNACKVAIAHIDLLIKFAKWADLPCEAKTDDDNHKALMQMIQIAQGELCEFENKKFDE